MLNTKLTSISACIGFVLSFIFGLFSKSPFYKILLTAIIFAVVFAALSFVINLIYEKLLKVEDSSEDQPKAEDFINNGTVGQNVNIVISDAELEQSASHNHFDVGDNHQMLNESDFAKKDKKESDEIDVISDNGFVPVRKAETVNNFSGTEAVNPGDTKSNSAKEAENIMSDDSLDVLPDMEGFKVSNDSGSGNQNGNSDDDLINIDDDSFVSSATSYKQSDVNPAENIDTSLMAKAISSVLAAESD